MNSVEESFNERKRGSRVNRELRTLRESKGLTQQQLADLIGVSKRQYINYETGTHLPNVRTGCILADALGTTPQELFMQGNVRTGRLAQSS